MPEEFESILTFYEQATIHDLMQKRFSRKYAIMVDPADKSIHAIRLKEVAEANRKAAQKGERPKPDMLLIGTADTEERCLIVGDFLMKAFPATE